MDVKSIVNQTTVNSSTNSIQSQRNSFSLSGLPNNKPQQDGATVNAKKNKDVFMTSEDLKRMVDELKKKISMLNTQLKIEMEKVGKDEEIPVVKVIDKNTNKVIRQIPPEYMLKIAKYIDEITGLLLDKKA